MNNPIFNLNEEIHNFLQKEAAKHSCSVSDVLHTSLSYLVKSAFDSPSQKASARDTEFLKADNINELFEAINNTNCDTSVTSSVVISMQLYSPYSVSDNFKNKGLTAYVTWYRENRENPVFPFDQLIDRTLYDKYPNLQHFFKEAVNEYLTKDEMEELKHGLTTHPDFSTSQFHENPVLLPITSSQAPLNRIKRGNFRFFFPLYDNSKIKLSFKVNGVSVGFHKEVISKDFRPGTKLYELIVEPIAKKYKL